jgi:acetyl-CoA acyltransferase
MSQSKALALGYPTDVVVASYAKTSIDPHPQLLLAPAIAVPKALEQAGITLDDIDLFEFHEAFAAQVLVTLKCLASPEFSKEYLGRNDAVGVVPLEKINANGSSIAIGHPFAATGGRIVTSLTNQLRKTGKRYGLISICAAGGIGGVMILENVTAK